MNESIILSLPRTKCENVRVLFSRIRLLFGVSVDPFPEDDSVFQDQGSPASECFMTAGMKNSGSNPENLKLMLRTIEGGPEQLNKARDYLLAACSDSSGRIERRCQYAPDIVQQLLPLRDEAERESSAMVRFEPQDNLVIVGGQERNVLAAIRFLDAKAQDIVAARAKGAQLILARPTDITALSQAGTQGREGFRHCRNLESEDSSYDSDYETTESITTPQDPADLRHDDVSRTVSDTLAAEFAEYVTTQDPNALTSQPLRDLSAILADPSYTSRVEFALKLGYTESQVQVALRKLGPQPSQNELLAELIKLGATTPSPGTNEGLQLSKDSKTEDLTELEAEILRPEIVDDSQNLRHIVIDGSNVAMSHGNKECFSCRGIKICVEWFKARGHQNITVFVPRWRKEVSRPDAPIKDQEILTQLEKERLLVFTPSRHVGGRRVACYDDRYVLRLAADLDGIVVSNDNYRDLAAENPEYRRIVEQRLLMYSFVNDRFMPPEDPLGRHGPSLDNFLRKTNVRISEPLPPPCPYGKKCTYGNKCKFYHPERGNQPQKSVTERLAEQAKIPLQEVKSRGLKSRESSPGDKLKPGSNQPSQSTVKKKQPLSRTKSLVPSPNISEGISDKCNIVERTKSDGSSVKCHGTDIGQQDNFFQPFVSSAFTPSRATWSASSQQMPITSVSSSLPSPTNTTIASWAALSPSLPPNIPGSCAEMFLEPDSGGHLFVAKRLSDPDTHGNKSSVKGFQPQISQDPSSCNLHRKLQRQLSLNPAFDPRLIQLGGYTAPKLLSPQEEQFGIMQQIETSNLDQRTSSQENIQAMTHGYMSRAPTHQSLSRMGSDSRVSSMLPTHIWEGIGGNEHQTVTRIASAPDSNLQWPTLTKLQHLNSTSDTRLNLFQRGVVQQSPLLTSYGENQSQQQWLSQNRVLELPRPMSPANMPIISSASGSTWPEQIARSSSQVMGQPVRPSSVPPHGMGLGNLSIPARPQTPELPSEARYKLEFHLSSIFPKEQVRAAMEMYPHETNPQKICAAILSMFPKS